MYNIRYGKYININKGSEQNHNLVIENKEQNIINIMQKVSKCIELYSVQLELYIVYIKLRIFAL